MPAQAVHEGGAEPVIAGRERAEFGLDAEEAQRILDRLSGVPVDIEPIFKTAAQLR